MKYEKVLQICLERVLEGGEPLATVMAGYPRWQAQLEPDIETALWLQARGPAFDPRPGFGAGTRPNQVVRWAATRPAVWGWRGRFEWPVWTFRRAFLALALLLALVLSGGGVALAAEDALPGEGLYPFKTGAEGLTLAFTPDKIRQTELHLQYAQDHLIAYAVLMSKGETEAASIALRNYDKHIAGVGQNIRTLTAGSHGGAEALSVLFNEVFLQDVRVFQILLAAQ